MGIPREFLCSPPSVIRQRGRKLSLRPSCFWLLEAGWEVGIIGQAEAGQFYPADPEGIAAASTVLVEAPCAEGIFLPSKFVDFVLTGRLVLAVAPRTGVLADLLSKEGGGLAVSCDSVEGVAEAVRKFHAAWLTGRLSESYGSERLMGLFSEKKVLKQYEDVFSRLRTCSVGQV